MEIKTNANYIRNVKCQDVYTESRADYTLPDYCGDMRKILFSDANLRPSGKFAGGDSTEFSGIVVYNVVYLDAEGELCSVEFSSDYEYSVKCSAENYKDSTADTKISNYAIRLMGPRRITATTSVVGSVRISEVADLSVSGNAFEGDSAPELNTKIIENRLTLHSESIEREFAEQLVVLDGAIADELSVVYSDADVHIESVDANDDSVNLKGKISVAAVIKNGNDPAYCVKGAMPFDEDLVFEDAGSCIKLVPEVVITSLKSSINATESGCEIVINTILEMSAVGEKNDRVTVITDGYLKNCETENRYNDLPFSRIMSAENVKGAHNAETLLTDAELDALEDIVFITALPKAERVETKDGVVTVFGEIKYSGLAVENVEGNQSYASIKFSSPFAVNVNLSCQNCDNIRPEIKMRAYDVDASFDNEKLYVNCMLEADALIFDDRSEKILSSSTKLEGWVESTESGIVVYYPDPSDTLFSVAKKFRTSSLKLAVDNNISESVFAADNTEGNLCGIGKLIIY